MKKIVRVAIALMYGVACAYAAYVFNGIANVVGTDSATRIPDSLTIFVILCGTLGVIAYYARNIDAMVVLAPLIIVMQGILLLTSTKWSTGAVETVSVMPSLTIGFIGLIMLTPWSLQHLLRFHHKV